MLLKQSKPLPTTSTWTARFLAAVTLTFGVAYACTTETGEEEVVSEDRTRLLEGSSQCVLDLTSEFTTSTAALSEKVEAWEGDPSDEGAHLAAQDAWKETMAVWQRLELAQFGPAAVTLGDSVGTQDLRDAIYSWPLVNSCKVDQILVSQEYESDLDTAPINARGLDALEHLLFTQEQVSDCNALALAAETFEAIEDLPTRRSAYALALTADLETQAKRLEEAWSADAGDFGSDFANAGNSGAYKSQGDAMSDLITGLIYVDSLLKDEKIGGALGYFGDCVEGTCPEKFEHAQAGVSRSSIEENVRGFELFFNGCGEGEYGVSELLSDEGASSLATDIESALSGIHEALDAIEEDDLRLTLQRDATLVEALYDAVKVLTDLLKGDFVEALEIELTVVSGEND